MKTKVIIRVNLRFVFLFCVSLMTGCRLGPGIDEFREMARGPLFNPVDPLPLADAVWVDGEIKEPYSVSWYSMDVIAETAYHIWINDALQGNGYKTVPLHVFIFYSSGSIIRSYSNHAWAASLSFTARSDDTVYIMVRGIDHTPTPVLSGLLTAQAVQGRQ